MTRPAWVRLDNASNIFLAARSDIDSKVFRISAELDHEVDPLLLQEALDATYDHYRLYHAVLRRGVFWHYLQNSALRPLVAPETQHTCAPIYQPDRPGLLFRVVYFQRRISLEIFHALSDGTGALWFVSDLITAYVQLEEARAKRIATDTGTDAGEDGDAEAAGTGRGAGDPDRPIGASPLDGAADTATGSHELTPDSFTHYFRKRRRRKTARTRPSFNDEADPPALAEAARAATDALEAEALETEPPIHPPKRRRDATLHHSVRGAYRVTGTRTPDNRTRLVELTMPAKQVVDLARAENVSITMYLIALFFESIRRASGGLGRRRMLAASVPVNLRQFFPSSSARNFFTTVRVQHAYGEGPDDLGSISRHLEEQFRPKVSPEALAKKLHRLSQFERMPALRIVPRPLKDLLLRWINRANNHGLTVAVSNLGRVVLPSPAESRVGRMLFHVSAVRPQFCAMSHAGVLTISFTSPFVETDHVREFARMLTASGVDVSVAAARVTEEEIAEDRPSPGHETEGRQL